MGLRAHLNIMKMLFAGPWVAEMGWEVMAWQAHVRSLAQDYDKVIVAGPSGHEGMYEYAYRYVPIDVDTTKANMWLNEPHQEDAFDLFQIKVGTDPAVANGDWLTPWDLWEKNRIGRKEEFVTALSPQEFIPFGKKFDSRSYDIVYHARFRDDWDSGFRNWTYEHCAEVMAQFPTLKIAAIGKYDRALHVPNTKDLRNIPLSELADVLHSSRCLIGPISGPVHFGVLTGVPQLTWATKWEHKERTTKKWNPLNSPIRCITADNLIWKDRIPWTPKVEEIVSGIKDILNG